MNLISIKLVVLVEICRKKAIEKTHRGIRKNWGKNEQISKWTNEIEWGFFAFFPFRRVSLLLAFLISFIYQFLWLSDVNIVFEYEWDMRTGYIKWICLTAALRHFLLFLSMLWCLWFFAHFLDCEMLFLLVVWDFAIDGGNLGELLCHFKRPSSYLLFICVTFRI